MIIWELCKRLKFDHTIKWYIHKPESVLENETHGILWDFEIQIDHPIRARRPDVDLINKDEKKQQKNLSTSGFAVPVNKQEKS